MKKLWVILPLLLLTACSRQQAEGQFSEADEPSVPNAPVLTQETVTQTESAGTTAAAETTASAAAQPQSETVTTEAFEPAFTVPVTEETAVQGGNGGEAHAEDTEPLYFNYMFFEEELVLRIAGGTYQVIAYDFTEALEHGVDALYYLQDADFDGDLDLCVPVHFANANVEHAVFLWDQAAQYYAETPVLITNPVFLESEKQISAVQHNSATESTLLRYAWENGALKEIAAAKADFAALTLTRTDENGEQPAESFASKEALEEAVSQYLG